MGEMKMSVGDGGEWSWRRKDPNSRGGSGIRPDPVGDDGGSSGLSSAPAGSDTQNGGRNSRIMMFGDVPVDLEATPNNPLFFTSSFNCNESPGKRRAAQERDMGADSQRSPEHCEVRAAPEVVRKKELASYDSDTHRRSDGVVNFIKKKTQVDLRNQETPRSDGSIQVEKLHTSTGLKDTTSLSASHFVNKRKPFDICLPRRRQLDFAETFDHIEDCEQTYEAVQLVEQENRLLRPGMVLLKNYITLREQIISHSFIKRAMGDAQDLVKKCDRRSNLSNDLPTMSPNICIINFYTTSGRLGLHQDRDESRESLRKGLPVVSFSIGDSAEFLFGDHRDVDRAERVVLQSGDVVTFGGVSRMVFHGISPVIPNSAPKALLDEAGLRPGRLNLAFRQF